MNCKKQYIEWLRVVSMIAVVFTHIGSTAHTDFSDTYYGSLGGVIFQSIVYVSHFAVPVFLMISGALLLNPDKKITIEKLLGKYVYRYAMVLLVFGCGYSYLELLFNSKKFMPLDFLIAFCNMLQGKTWAHMWYLYVLLGIMLVLPVFRAVVKACSHRELVYLLIIFFVFTSLLPVISALTGIKSGIIFPVQSIYIFYLLLGYVLDKNEIKNRYKLFWLEGILLVILVITAYMHIMQNKNLPFGEYYSPVIVCVASSIFLLFKNMKLEENKIITFLSNMSFGVYIIHMFWINMIFKLLRIDPVVPNVLTGFAVAFCTLALSVCSTWIMKKIPLLKRIV